MGLWSNDQRQGYGVVVTVDGVYYEGKFFLNRLAVNTYVFHVLTYFLTYYLKK